MRPTDRAGEGRYTMVKLNYCFYHYYYFMCSFCVFVFFVIFAFSYCISLLILSFGSRLANCALYLDREVYDWICNTV